MCRELRGRHEAEVAVAADAASEFVMSGFEADMNKERGVKRYVSRGLGLTRCWLASVFRSLVRTLGLRRPNTMATVTAIVWRRRECMEVCRKSGGYDQPVWADSKVGCLVSTSKKCLSQNGNGFYYIYIYMSMYTTLERNSQDKKKS